MDWRTIETAPDKGRFLVYVPIKGHRMVIAMRGSAGLLLDEQAQPMRFPASHWMPLPKAPRAEI